MLKKGQIADRKCEQGNFYRVYGRAFVKVILLSLLVYQGIYYGWLQLEHFEQKRGKDGMSALKTNQKSSFINMVIGIGMTDMSTCWIHIQPRCSSSRTRSASS